MRKEKEFLRVDTSGREYKAVLSLDDMKEICEDEDDIESEKEREDLTDWLDYAEPGDTFTRHNEKFVRIK